MRYREVLRSYCYVRTVKYLCVYLKFCNFTVLEQTIMTNTKQTISFCFLTVKLAMKLQGFRNKPIGFRCLYYGNLFKDILYIIVTVAPSMLCSIT